ncbi:MAG: TetR/AcrR family transcriptional regulator [Gammaproteobacteria bacterium]|nr:TetR/AcrR family transcriptional regulator [Gammaproteobacteria bacterium]
MELDLNEVFRRARTPKGHRARRRILISTAEMLGKRGADNLSVQAICESAQISRTSLYNYFDDVDEVLQALTLGFVEEISEQFEIIHGNQPRGAARLAYCLRFVLERALGDPTWGRLAVNLAEVSPVVETYLQDQVEFEMRAAIDEGDMQLTKPELKAFLSFVPAIVFGSCTKLANSEMPRQQISPIVSLVLRAGGLNASLAQKFAGQKINRKILSRSWLVRDFL